MKPLGNGTGQAPGGQPQGGAKPRALVVVPCYNEEAVLEKTLSRLRAFCAERLGEYSWRLVVADNSSTDATARIGRDLSEKLPEVAYFRSEKKGRGHALRECWSAFPADIHAYMDSDLATDLVHLPPLLDAVRYGADLAVGCRLIPGARVIGRSASREASSRGYNLVLKAFFQNRFRDAQCGFKAVGNRVIRRVLPLTRDDHWFFDSEVLILSERMGLAICEVPVTWEEHLERDTKVKLFRDISFFLRQVIRLRRRLWFDSALRKSLLVGENPAPLQKTDAK